MADTAKLPTSPDETPPQNRTIALYTAVAVFTLFGLKFFFDSYFDSTMSAETERKVRSSASHQIDRLHDREAAALAAGPLPIDEAMQRVASPNGRMIDTIRPLPSQDLAARKGWDHLPAFVSSADVHIDTAPAAPPAPPAAPTPAEPAPGDVAPAVAPPTGAVAPAAPAPAAPAPAAPAPAAPAPAAPAPAAPAPAAPAPAAPPANP